MAIPEPLLLGGSVIGFAAASFAVFVGVSYIELQSKIQRQIETGEEPYQLKVEKRRLPKQKKEKKSKGARRMQ